MPGIDDYLNQAGEILRRRDVEDRAIDGDNQWKDAEKREAERRLERDRMLRDDLLRDDFVRPVSYDDYTGGT